MGLDPRPEDLLLVLVAEGGRPDIAGLQSVFANGRCPFLGGLFPELLVGSARHEVGALVLRCTGLGEPVVVQDFDDSAVHLAALAATLPPRGDSRPTAIVWVDGLVPGISRFLGATYNEFGGNVRYWGGGAGSLDLDGRPSLFTRAGVFSGAGAVALAGDEASLGVHHGWCHFRGPLVATRTRGNRVEQLNWKPAAEVYGAAIRHTLQGKDAELELSELMSSYPLGIQRQGDDFIVRDPVRVDAGGALICVGDVPENTVLSILQSGTDALIAAAGRAAEEAAAEVEAPVRHCLVADCVSRVRCLGDAFDKELDAIGAGLGELSDTAEPVGMLTLGEISSRGDGFLEFFNKTCVVAVLRG